MLSPESVNHILRRKRKGRFNRPCYPCRQRKVKCDTARPCKQCVDRSHEELCSYEPSPESKAKKPSSSSHSTSTVGHVLLSDGLVAPPVRFHNQTTPTKTLVQSEDVAASDPGVLLGDQSVPSFVAENYYSSNPSAAKMKDATLPMLGLQSLDDKSLPRWNIGNEEVEKLLDILPAKDQILELLARYRHVVHPLNPFLVDLNAFELRLCTHLEAVSSPTEGIKLSQLFGHDLDWAALLFAVLACGLQSTSTQTSESKAAIRRYVSTAYQCLGITQGLLKPSIKCLQALIIIVQVLQNELMTEAAWTLLGLLSRQAQSLGLHNVKFNSQRDGGKVPYHLKLWWTIMWQDALLCMCFDRAPVTAVKSLDPFHTLLPRDEPLDYQEGMYTLTYLVLMGSARNHALISIPPTYEKILADVNDVEQIRTSLRAPISARKNCKSMQDHIEQLCFQLHSSFTIGTLLRPSLSPKKWTHLSHNQRDRLASMCLGAYKSSLHAYLDLLTTSIVARRSLAMLHNGLASALILAITGYSKVDREVVELQGRLFRTLYDQPDADGTENRFWGPHRRGLLALKEMYEHQSSRNADQQNTLTVQTQFPSNIPDTNLQDAQSNLPPIVGSERTEAELLSDFSNLDYFSLDPQMIGEISSFLPDNTNENEIMIDDIFDAVLWGGYGGQEMHDSEGLI
ncbi:hypothetical protein BGW36DRAFT_368435 [Talaromyces proteolyticus]|uniref:Zn(2)-C6 fungal-type domain-containing protein n=1 Tax=Talaromyces proteolyticus TaxID=1131652 RepID=A0AAD4Q734_9EURO|nr:uncharacterized protein BGW36DRAFT_368435 [Talaromyces proteolyticus]KAH8705942.1 hypothetical protein BGW36DRAFT_368435 [Talaromyces proteolyticus]